MQRSFLCAAFLAAAAFVLTPNSSEAQSVYGFDGGGSLVVEMTGPPNPALCNYPNGPILSVFPTFLPFVCPLPAALAPPPNPDGDITVNRTADTVFVTDGLIIGEYVASGLAGAIGTPINGWNAVLPAGAPITGMGWDNPAQLLWLTDGLNAWAVVPPPPPGCAPALVAVPPFALPVPVGAIATDIDWDPLTGSLFYCDTFGNVANVFPGGFPGPFGMANVVGMCGLAPLLSGLALDRVGGFVNGTPTFYVTDGFQIAYLMFVGPGVFVMAPPTFYTPLNCFPTMGPMLGLGYADRGLPYGFGADNSGLAAPFIGSIGEPLMPNPGFQVTISGSVPGSNAILFMSQTGLFCPPPVVQGLPLYINILTPPAVMGFAGINGMGDGVVPVPVPPGFFPGLNVWFQYFAVTPSGSYQVTEGLSVILDLP